MNFRLTCQQFIECSSQYNAIRDIGQIMTEVKMSLALKIRNYAGNLFLSLVICFYSSS